MIAYFNGEYLSKEDIRISPDDRAFLFADSLYEAVRSYQGHLFRVKDHLERLSQGAEQLKFMKTDFSFLENVLEELIQKNDLVKEDAVIYFQVSRGCALKRTHAFPEPEVDLTVYAKASCNNTTALQQDMDDGIKIITVPDERWANCNIKTTGLLGNVLAKQAATQAGVTEAVFIRDGLVLEGSSSNFFMVVNDTVVTAPLSNLILGGITRKVVLELCRKNNIPFQERAIQKKELYLATEMFVTSTSKQATPVIRFNGEKVGSGSPGPVTRSVQKLFETQTAPIKNREV